MTKVTEKKSATKKNVNEKKSKTSKASNNVKRQNVSKSVSSRKSSNKKKSSLAALKSKSVIKHTKILIVLFALLSIVATYAWFSTNLNVKIKTFNMLIMRNTDLTISFDGITFSRSLELNREKLINIVNTYPAAVSQWADNGLIPVSSPGITDHNSYFFDIYQTSGVLYTRKNKVDGFLTTVKSTENVPHTYSSFISFDLFIKNESGSPVADNLYVDGTTAILPYEEIDEQMEGLINSFRLGFVKVGSVSHNATVAEIQNIQCNNDCYSRIYEPYSQNHTGLSIERAKKYGINLINGNYFPTYAYIKEGGPLYVKNSVSGSPNIDPDFFRLQETITDTEEEESLFTIPDGITKVRIYLWIEGQDIDSLETDSTGTEIDVNIDFVKDMEGYTAFEE